MVKDLFDSVRHYFETKVELVKLEAKEEIAEIVAKAIGFVILAIFGLFFLAFASSTLARGLNQALNSEYLGFAIVTGFYLVLLVVLFVMLKTNTLKKISDNFVAKSFVKDKEKDKK